MNAREQYIENIVIGSLLSNSAYLRDAVCITDEMLSDSENRRIFAIVCTCTGAIPVNEIIDRFNAGDIIDIALVVRCMELAAVCDFDVLKWHHNSEAVCDYYFGTGGKKPTEVQFREYVSQLLRNYARRTHPTSRPRDRGASLRDAPALPRQLS